MYTTNSRFNNEVMTEYMVTGKAITSPRVPSLLENSLDNAYLPALNFNLSHESRNDSSTPTLDLLSLP